eukprot:13169050-Alexandrium_andersonii.AAC.1
MPSPPPHITAPTPHARARLERLKSCGAKLCIDPVGVDGVVAFGVLGPAEDELLGAACGLAGCWLGSVPLLLFLFLLFLGSTSGLGSWALSMLLAGQLCEADHQLHRDGLVRDPLDGQLADLLRLLLDHDEGAPVLLAHDTDPVRCLAVARFPVHVVWLRMLGCLQVPELADGDACELCHHAVVPGHDGHVCVLGAGGNLDLVAELAHVARVVLPEGPVALTVEAEEVFGRAGRLCGLVALVR